MDTSTAEMLLPDGTMELVYSEMSPEIYQFLSNEPQFQLHSDLLEPDVLEGLNMQGFPGENFAIMPDSTETLGSGGTIDIPSPTCRLPSFKEYPGQLEFKVQLNNEATMKTSGVFSEKLKKIFVTMGTKIPFEFKWKEYDANLYVRALPIFLEGDSWTEPVKRCPSHSSEKEKSNKGFVHVDHVIRCDNEKTIYDKNEESGRLSVLVPLDPPQPGAEGTTIMFTFMCKNSCVLGMNRRATGIIFTLETENGTVVGRRAMKLRICSCPKRDWKKEESFVAVKTEPTDLIVPDGKKLITKKKPLKRLMTNNSHEMTTLQIPVPRIFKSQIIRIVREFISMPRAYRELTEAEKTTVDACNMLE